MTIQDNKNDNKFKRQTSSLLPFISDVKYVGTVGIQCIEQHEHNSHFRSFLK